MEGVTRAIRRFHAPGRRVSIYVLGDDFSRGSIQAVIDTVNRLNRAGPGGRRLVRIHAIGFPVLLLKAVLRKMRPGLPHLRAGWPGTITVVLSG